MIYIGVSLHSARINTQPLLKRRESTKSKQGGGWDFFFFFLFFLLLQRGPRDIATVAHHISSVGTGKKPNHEGGERGGGLGAWGRGPSVDSKAKQLKPKIRGGCETVFALRLGQQKCLLCNRTTMV